MALLSGPIRKASFDGISFEVTSSSLIFGRRTAVFEYPQNDTPYVEDLGKATRQISVEAFVTGADCTSRAKRLITAIEKSHDSGSTGKLVHPWLGSLNVVPVDTPSVSWDLKSRIVTLSLKFVEAGELRYPSNTISFGSKLLESADSLYESILPEWDIDAVTSVADDIAENVSGTIGALQDSKFSKLFALGNSLADFATNITSNISSTAENLKSEILNTLSIAPFANTKMNWRTSTSAITSVASSSAMSTNYESTKELTDYSSDNIQTITNASAQLEQALRLSMIGNALGAVSLINSAADQNENTSMVTVCADDIIEIRNNVLNMLEAEMIRTQTDDSNIYNTLASAYSSTFRYLTDEAMKLGEMESFTVSSPTPSVVLAYEKYGDASRNLEIVQRNNIANPMFVPPSTIRVSKA